MNNTSTGPWFEYYPPDHSRPQVIPVESLPFTIGRNDAADYTIASTRVSREHARLSFEDGRYIVADLGSTNGTLVNGEKIDTRELLDGDTVTIADVELNFLTGGSSGAASEVTQAMHTGSDEAAHSAAETGPEGGFAVDEGIEIILGVRRMQQALTQRCVSCRIEPVIRLSDDQLFGYQVHPGSNQFWPAGPRQLAGCECRLNERVAELTRLFAAEQSTRLPTETHLFFSVASSEVGVHWVPESLSRLQETVLECHRVVVQIPDTAVCDIPYFRNFLRRLRERGILIAYDGFAGGRNQVEELKDIVPDFLKLSHTIIRGIDRSSGGQRQIQSVVQSAAELGCQVVAKGMDDETVFQISRELGCDFGQGTHFGKPAPLDEILTRTPVAF